MQPLLGLCPHCHITIAWSYNGIEEDRCPYCYSWLEPAWKKRMTAEPFIANTAEALAKWVDDLEVVQYENIDLWAAAAQKALDAVSGLGHEELTMRVRLVQSIPKMRKGDLEGAGVAIREINKWAVEHSNNVILSRSFRQLSNFFLRVGDASSALECALSSLEYLPSESLPQTRGHHLMALAVALNHNGEHGESRRRYEEVLEIDESTQHVQQALYALNNMAYTQYKIGDMKEASCLLSRMLELVQKHELSLYAFQLDTIARIKMSTGKTGEAVSLLEPLMGKYAEGQLQGDVFMFFESQITLLEAYRQLGEYDRAQDLLHRVKPLCEEHGAAGYTVKIKLEQAELYAAKGRYKEAYEEYRDYHESWEKLRSEERESRARILHTVFETEEARRRSEQYREMANRDPLTGMYNRRFIDAYADTLLNPLESEREITAILIDLDHFKRINDTLSHEAGDAVLVQLAKLLDAAAIDPAKAARLGGEEFLILCPGFDAAKGLEFAERLCELIRTSNWSSIIGELPVTASIGVSTAYTGRTTRAALFAEADRRLYLAKSRGRNCVVATG
ncbi:sensor domain-containing diguanylate cyclase [Paenibacillus soyae]|uniref:Diguanylate cyclase n=1 Tax=Paenibacillus soyae TaxID=2969249 RepID=A0A9X2SBX3_9BACL|nr:tetratricopeptide repeat-containing diguanylate cyclase [Paenibacillus soyae]MCR2807666.1 diguanylate cyclase [Paenibacillus soyae]